MMILNDFKNDLLSRRELKFMINETSNPSFASSSKIVADEFKSAEDVIVVKKIEGKFGTNEFVIDAYIYNAVKDKERIEQKKKVKVKKDGAQ